MENDREARARVNGAMSPERLRAILDRHRDAEEICFTSGEPTLHPRLIEYVRWCRAAGYRRVSLMTNGRRLSYRPYAIALVHAGLTRVYVSIHGHEAKLHDGLTRAPGSFHQTITGLRVAASLRSHGLQLHTSTVLTRRNLSFLTSIYEMLVDLAVQQVVFNGLQVQGGAEAHFARLVPRYRDVRAAFDALVVKARDGAEKAFLVDVPPCVTEGLPDRNRGYMERRVHYEVRVPGVSPPGAVPCDGIEGVHAVTSRSLRETFRVFGPSCAFCRYRTVCPGVYPQYAKEHGWQDLRPVPEEG